MTRFVKFVASDIEPNPAETLYWVDLNEDPLGGSIKTYNNEGKWVRLKVLEGSLTDVFDRLDEIEEELLNIDVTPDWGNIENKPVFALVSYSGSYNDLKDTPEIPSLVGYATENWVNQLLQNKQDKLTAGDGIQIVGNVISSTLDVTLYEVVTQLPSSSINPNKIYLLADNQSGPQNKFKEYIWVNNNWELLGEYKAVVDLTPYLTKTEAADTYALKSEIGSATYQSSFQSKSMKAAPSWNDINGKTLSDLEGKTFSQIFDMILFTTVNPTFTSPSVSISSSWGSNGRTVEVGTTGPTLSSFSYTFNKGSIVITYPDGTRDTSQGGRAGNETGHTYSPSTFPTTLPWGTSTYRITVNYAQGPQPKDSKGNNYSTPLPAGSVSSNYTVKAGYYYYAGLGNLDQASMKKTIIVSDTTYAENTFDAEGTDRWVWWLPAKKTATKMEFFDTGSNTYKDDDLTNNWNIETVQINGVSYNKIINKNSTKRGSIKLKLTFTNA